MVRTRRQSRLHLEPDEVEKPFDSDEWTNASSSPSAASTVTQTQPRRSGRTVASTVTIMTPSAAVRKTPNRKAPIKPDGKEMHPARHHSSTTPPYNEEHWLGFFNMAGANTEPAKRGQGLDAKPRHFQSSPTPHTTEGAAKVANHNDKFTFPQQPIQLGPEAQQMLDESREEAARIRRQMVQAGNVPGVALSARKIAKPKGKIGRFSDVHMADFKKMDSIANHPSKWRTDPQSAGTVGHQHASSKTTSESQPLFKSLKRTSSKAELDKPSVPSTLKRTLSKSNLDSPRNSPKTLTVPRELYPTLNVPQKDPAAPAAKRTRLEKDEDGSKARFHNEMASKIPTTPRPAQVSRSNFLSPTKATIARSSSAKSLRNTQIPALVRSKSTKDLTQTPQAQVVTYPDLLKPATPSPVKTMNLMDGAAVSVTPLRPNVSPSPVRTLNFKKDAAPSPAWAPGSNNAPKKFSGFSKLPQKIKSILRTPRHLYSNDPSKLAAGTHLATPPKIHASSQVPATEPIRKHVEFTASTKDREDAKTPPAEPEEIAYPVVRGLASPTLDRRITLSNLPMPGAFNFRSPTPVQFTQASSTIRQVRSSDTDVIGIRSPAKRKLHATLSSVTEYNQEGKENVDEREIDERPAKKMRVIEKSLPVPEIKAPTVQTVKKAVRDAAANKNKGKSTLSSRLTASRLAYLSMPKKRN